MTKEELQEKYGVSHTEHLDGTVMEKQNHIAKEIIDSARDSLVLRFNLFDRAILKMSAAKAPDQVGMGSDGVYIYYNPSDVIGYYKEDKNSVCRRYLHLALHMAFLHPYRLEAIDISKWDLACDMAVEWKILELKEPSVSLKRDRDRIEILEKYQKKYGEITAERIYHNFASDREIYEKYERKASLFKQDNHYFWRAEKVENENGNDEGIPIELDLKTYEEWKKIGGAINTETSARQENMGFSSSKLMKRFTDVKNDSRDYTSFLISFAKRKEVIRINPDEFDYIYYNFGMEHYNRMPLIEPLEYMDAPRITEFVIAIDTSGSCQGEKIKRFLNSTYSILKNSEIFSGNLNLHIIQCDCEIQSDVKIKGDAEFDSYMKDIEIKGYGGTDFRPVFSYVEKLCQRKEFQRLDGLLYFTDGIGMFPMTEPSFKTAFVMEENEKETGVENIPSWAEVFRL